MNTVIIFGEEYQNCAVLKDARGIVVGIRTDSADYHYLGDGCDLNGNRINIFPEYLPSMVEKLVVVRGDSNFLGDSDEEMYSRVCITCALAGISLERNLFGLLYEGAGFQDWLIVENVKEVTRRLEPVEVAWEEVSKLAVESDIKSRTASKALREAESAMAAGVFLTKGAEWLEAMTEEERTLFNLLVKRDPDGEGPAYKISEIGEKLGCSHTTIGRRRNKLAERNPTAGKQIDDARKKKAR